MSASTIILKARFHLIIRNTILKLVPLKVMKRTLKDHESMGHIAQFRIMNPHHLKNKHVHVFPTPY